MTTTPPNAFLAGKVIKTSLSTIQGRPPPGAPRLKRLLLDQGELSHFWDGEEPIRYIAFVELRQGSIRGNHYHTLKREFLYVISGAVRLIVQDVQGRDRITLPVGTGELVEIGTRVAHAFQVVDAGQAVEFSEARFDGADVYPFPLE